MCQTQLESDLVYIMELHINITDYFGSFLVSN